MPWNYVYILKLLLELIKKPSSCEILFDCVSNNHFHWSGSQLLIILLMENFGISSSDPLVRNMTTFCYVVITTRLKVLHVFENVNFYVFFCFCFICTFERSFFSLHEVKYSKKRFFSRQFTVHVFSSIKMRIFFPRNIIRLSRRSGKIE